MLPKHDAPRTKVLSQTFRRFASGLILP